MKAEEESKRHVQRESAHLQLLKEIRNRIGRKKMIQPARDDRGETKPWRPGLSK